MSFFDQILSAEPKLAERQARVVPPGQLVRLSDGVTYYELGGPQNGRPVVLIHGFSVPNFIWDPTFAALAAAGFRVLRYDLFGRGLSDRPKISYDKALYVRQLAELMDTVEFSDADVISLSMGGVVAAEFAYRFPKRVGKLVFISPAGFDLGLPFSIKLLYVGGLGELLFEGLDLFGRGTILASMFKDFYNPTQQTLDAFSERYLDQMQYPGFKGAILSSLRTGMLDEDLTLFRRVGETGKPVLLIWGEQDRTVPFRNNETFRKLVPQAEFQAIENSGHIAHFEKPEIVNPALIRFLG
jgi:pimeloyl-ACP methyl ester carboxylesterase